MDCKICAIVSQWWKQPFKENGSVADWFFFVGLIAAISWLWSRILMRIK